MKLQQTLAIVFFLLQSTAAVRPSIFKKVSQLSTIATKSVYKELSITSRIECSAICAIDGAKGCNSYLYSKEQQSCLLTNLFGNSSLKATIYPDTESSVSLDYLYSLMSKSLTNIGPIVNSTSGLISFSKTVDARSELDCQLSCLLDSSLNCSMAFYQSKVCFIGQKSSQNVTGSVTTGHIFVSNAPTMITYIKTSMAISSASYSSKIIKSLRVNTTGEDFIYNCLALCLLDASCKFVIPQLPNCLFGDPAASVVGNNLTFNGPAYGNYDGGWSAWGPWSACSLNCSLSGTSSWNKTRTRTCSLPPTTFGGRTCTNGTTTDTLTCNTCFDYCTANTGTQVAYGPATSPQQCQTMCQNSAAGCNFFHFYNKAAYCFLKSNLGSLTYDANSFSGPKFCP